MYKNQVKCAIGVLMQLFYSEDFKNEELALQTMELYISELGLLKDIRLIAEEVEEMKAFSLLAPMKVFDYEFVMNLEELLKEY